MEGNLVTGSGFSQENYQRISSLNVYLQMSLEQIWVVFKLLQENELILDLIE